MLTALMRLYFGEAKYVPYLYALRKGNFQYQRILYFLNSKRKEDEFTNPPFKAQKTDKNDFLKRLKKIIL